MKRCSTKDLRKLEIINLCDGARLGCASDFEFDCEDAKILALVISGNDGIFGVGREDDIIIPWHKVECFGEDTILVKVNPQELSKCCGDRERKKNRKFPW